MKMGHFHPRERRDSHRARRRAVAVTLGLALTITGFAAASAYGAPAKPRYVPKVSGHDATLPAGLQARPDAKGAAAQAQSSSTTSTGHAASADAPESPEPSGPRSTDPALKPVDLGALTQQPSVLNGLQAKAEAQGSVRVIVTLNTKFTALGALTSSAAASQKLGAGSLCRPHAPSPSSDAGKVVSTYDGNIPAVALTATTATL